MKIKLEPWIYIIALTVIIGLLNLIYQELHMFNSLPENASCEFNFNIEKGIVMSDFEDEKANGYIAGIIDARDIVNQKIIQIEQEKPVKNDEKIYRLEALREISQELTFILEAK